MADLERETQMRRLAAFCYAYKGVTSNGLGGRKNTPKWKVAEEFANLQKEKHEVVLKSASDKEGERSLGKSWEKAAVYWALHMCTIPKIQEIAGKCGMKNFTGKDKGSLTYAVWEGLVKSQSGHLQVAISKILEGFDLSIPTWVKRRLTDMAQNSSLSHSPKSMAPPPATATMQIDSSEIFDQGFVQGMEAVKNKFAAKEEQMQKDFAIREKQLKDAHNRELNNLKERNAQLEREVRRLEKKEVTRVEESDHLEEETSGVETGFGTTGRMPVRAANGPPSEERSSVSNTPRSSPRNAGRPRPFFGNNGAFLNRQA
ncbi:hypothetical protein M427DRAFT_141647 [Gonapodya prolifera JEL478]|uniref:Uncharacterized protein n=1 Tax=Gonapodya prolifera (strain JEL478) TaxID=1344416 RepID=A0A138ZWI5_GONPJ|nr:hypothetical protein M427DRAFT_141647 [Gonapodya prolifera JEL478]|eukprot:KXS08858.1 hypothetical protein M427DRAFT_141647 [Gonapodya prolifera JEL478]